MTGKNPGVVCFVFVLAALFALAACGGPKVVYTAKVGAVSYPPVTSSAVSVFDSTPQKGSYIELGEVAIEDELKCDMGKAYEEERALGVLERLRKENPDMADVSDTTMLELLAERGSIDRGDICTLVLRFSRKEEKSSFITMALKGSNLKLMASKAGEMGANAVMKIKHHDWQMRQNPSSFGADATQVPGLKVGVKTTGIAIHYEGPEGEAAPAEKEDKVLVVVTGKTEEGEEKPEKAAKKPEKVKAGKSVEAKAEKGKPAAAAEKKEEKKAAAVESSVIQEEAKKKADEIAAMEKAIEEKQNDQKELKTGITADKEKVKELKKEMMKLKMKAAKAKAEEDKLKQEEEKKAKAQAKKMDKEKLEAEKKALADAKAKDEAKMAEKKEEKAAEKETKKDEKEAKKDVKAAEKEPKKDVKVAAKDIKKEGKGKDEEGDADVSESVKEAKDKVKGHKSKIFDCLHDGKMEGAIKVTFLFKPSGEIDALGFSPEAPEKVHKCIMQFMAKEKFPPAGRYYKAIFKYTVK